MTEKTLNTSLPASSQGSLEADSEILADMAVDTALLLVGTHCPHCPSVITAFGEMVKSGELARIEIINLEQQPEVAQQLHVRTVPWVKIGAFELEGQHSKAEYQQWLARAKSVTGMRDYIEELLVAGKVAKVTALIEQDNASVHWLFELMRDPDAKINLKLGIGVVMEEFASAGFFQSYIGELEGLCDHEDVRVRADACHYLSLTKNDSVLPVLQKMLDDEDAEVREVAQDGIDQLRDAVTS